MDNGGVAIGSYDITIKAWDGTYFESVNCDGSESTIVS